MRLTRSDKEAFIRAVMDDVPMIDYDEMARKLVVETIDSIMPEEIRVAHKKFPEWFKTDTYIDTPYGCPSMFVFAPDSFSAQNHSELWKRLKEIGELANAQQKARSALERKVIGMIETCTTLKAAQERLPEFLKYLPADRDGTGVTNLPVANTVTALMEAGWPKKKAA